MSEDDRSIVDDEYQLFEEKTRKLLYENRRISFEKEKQSLEFEKEKKILVTEIERLEEAVKSAEAHYAQKIEKLNAHYLSKLSSLQNLLSRAIVKPSHCETAGVSNSGVVIHASL